MMLKGLSIATFLFAAGFGLASLPADSSAQDKSVALRLSNMEEQMRQLYGQIEELSLQVQQLNQELARLRKTAAAGGNAGGGANQPLDQAPQVAAQDGVEIIAPDPLESDGYATSFENIQPDNPDDDLQAYQMGELDQPATPDAVGGGGIVETAPGPKPLGYLPGSGMNAAPVPNSASGDTYTPNEVETASLDPAAMANAPPEKLYEKSYESLLRRRYGEAEAGFRTFIERYNDHELAGNAEFWLGETYYVQSDYKRAAQAFLSGYQSHPANRKAPDSLLKLGMSLKQLGQKDQACAAFATVAQKFPKAAETLKRAQNESTKAGC